MKGNAIVFEVYSSSISPKGGSIWLTEFDASAHIFMVSHDVTSIYKAYARRLKEKRTVLCYTLIGSQVRMKV